MGVRGVDNLVNEGRHPCPLRPCGEPSKKSNKFTYLKQNGCMCHLCTWRLCLFFTAVSWQLGPGCNSAHSDYNFHGMLDIGVHYRDVQTVQTLFNP